MRELRLRSSVYFVPYMFSVVTFCISYRELAFKRDTMNKHDEDDNARFQVKKRGKHQCFYERMFLPGRKCIIASPPGILHDNGR